MFGRWTLLSSAKCPATRILLFGTTDRAAIHTPGKLSARLAPIGARTLRTRHLAVLSEEIPLSCRRWWGCRDVDVWLSILTLPGGRGGVATLVGGSRYFCFAKMGGTFFYKFVRILFVRSRYRHVVCWLLSASLLQYVSNLSKRALMQLCLCLILLPNERCTIRSVLKVTFYQPTYGGWSLICWCFYCKCCSC